MRYRAVPRLIRHHSWHPIDRTRRDIPIWTHFLGRFSKDVTIAGVYTAKSILHSKPVVPTLIHDHCVVIKTT